MAKRFKVGERVHIDADTFDWGRVASDATVLAVEGRKLFVSVDSIRASITVKATDVVKKEGA